MPNVESIERCVRKIEGSNQHPPLIVWQDVYGGLNDDKEINSLPGQEGIYASWMCPDERNAISKK